jgi:glycosyltransferase involved in cell wall biosynthesis
MLPTLVAQELREFRCTVIDQSDDPAVAERLIAGLGDDRIRHVAQRARGKSRALNLALSMTSAPVVAFTDDDCTVPPGWLREAVAAVERMDMPGVIFGEVDACAHDPRRVFVPAISFGTATTWHHRFHRSPGLIGMGANMVVDRRIFEVCGGFDADLGPGGVLATGEECEFAYRALRRGYWVRQEPKLEVLHWGARSVTDASARDLVVGGFFAISAGFGKHLRSGDLWAAVVMLDEFASATAQVARAVLRRRGPYHIRRLLACCRGFAAGLRRGLAVPPCVSSGGEETATRSAPTSDSQGRSGHAPACGPDDAR